MAVMEEPRRGDVGRYKNPKITESEGGQITEDGAEDHGRA